MRHPLHFGIPNIHTMTILSVELEEVTYMDLRTIIYGLYTVYQAIPDLMLVSYDTYNHLLTNYRDCVRDNHAYEFNLANMLFIDGVQLVIFPDVPNNTVWFASSELRPVKFAGL